MKTITEVNRPSIFGDKLSTPWRFDEDPECPGSGWLRDATSNSVGYGTRGAMEPTMRMVNSHEALLSALKNIRANIEYLPAIIERGAVMVGDRESIESMRVWADEAIAQAEGVHP
jgi:hypothetical protein